MDDINMCIDKIKEEADLNKYANYYFLLLFWMGLIEKGNTLNQFFIRRGYKKIAIYGMGHLGKHLETQLSDDLQPVFTVDQGIVNYQGMLLPLNEATDILSKADVIVITPVSDYETIKEMFNSSAIEVISLEEVILSL